VNKVALISQVLRPYFLHIAALISVVMFGWGVGYIKVSTPPPEVDIADNWTLPRWAPHQPEQSWSELARLELWGEDDRAKMVDESPEPRDDFPWRFIGILEDGSSRLAVIELGQDGGLKHLTTGDNLPDGAEILRIGAGDLTFSDSGSEAILKLFSVDED
jgi:hypothetical protein